MRKPLGEDWTAMKSGPTENGIGLQSSRTSERLNQIDRVRSNGVGDHIALPQLAVCGDQSAGKSSVLEGISGIPFPRQDGLCTRFATEIILRHNPSEERTTATIIPHITRMDEEKDQLAAFSRNVHDFGELPEIIEQAAKLMGVRCDGASTDAPSFAADVLRLEVVGNTGFHLTLVDLPGLISVSERNEDVQLVSDLVESYLCNSRTIILAVVPASSDVDTQRIIQMARQFDQEGLRTVGVITKPDLINEGTESRIVRLAKNLDRTRLSLGFFLLKNPAPADVQKGMTMSERRRAELQFFSSGPWKAQGLNHSRIGIDNLRIYLQDLLDQHIERELPRVRRDVRKLLNEVNEELLDLGAERSLPSEIRMYLTRVSTEFQNLVNAGLDGAYGGQSDFFSIEKSDTYRRLRAAVHMENEKFASYMRDHGQKRKIVTADEQTEAEAEEDQLLVTTDEMSAWIKQVYYRTRGRELSGTYNHALLAELFHVQSARWGGIARNHVQVVIELVSQFVHSALASVIRDIKTLESVQRSVKATLEGNIEKGFAELDNLLQDEAGYPITYNHYYTDNIQRSRNDRSRKHLHNSMENAISQDWNGRFHFSNSSDEINRLVTSLQDRVVVDMRDQACSEAQIDLGAYYKVAMKTFIDNVCRQVIERHILTKLPGIFNPVVVSSYADNDLLQLAAESSQISRRRIEFRHLREALEESLKDLA